MHLTTLVTTVALAAAVMSAPLPNASTPDAVALADRKRQLLHPVKICIARGYGAPHVPLEVFEEEEEEQKKHGEEGKEEEGKEKEKEKEKEHREEEHYENEGKEEHHEEEHHDEEHDEEHQGDEHKKEYEGHHEYEHTKEYEHEIKKLEARKRKGIVCIVL